MRRPRRAFGSPLTAALVAAVLVAVFPRAGWLVAAAASIAALADPWPSAAALVALRSWCARCCSAAAG